MASSPDPGPAAPVHVEVRAGESPAAAPVPMWLTACVRLAPPLGRTGKPLESADKVFPVAQALLADRVRVHGETAVELDRDRLARRAGYPSAKKAGWIFEYLEQVGFLRVLRNYESGTGRRSPDTFVTYEQPPAGYVGPRTHVELTRALEEQDAAARVLFVDLNADESGNRRSEPTSPRENLGSEPYFPPGEPRTQNRRSEPTSPRENLGSEPYFPPGEPRTQNRRSEPTSPRENLAISNREIEDLSSRDLRSINQESASPPATGGPGDDALNQRVRVELVRQMPWRQRGHVLTLSEEQRLVPVIAAAISDHGYSFEQARDHALYKLDTAPSSSNPARWVAGGFEHKHLPVPTDETLELPSTAQSRTPDTAAAHEADSDQAARESQQEEPGTPVRPETLERVRAEREEHQRQREQQRRRAKAQRALQSRSMGPSEQVQQAE